jgi:hypothetical protein
MRLGGALKFKYLLAAVIAPLTLIGCATSYGPEQITGGFKQEQLKPDRWRVTFAANGYTTRETAQTYWLYRCAELTREQGYDAFVIVTPIGLTSFEPAPDGKPHLVLTHGGGGGTVVFVPVYGGAYSQAPKPLLTGEIQMMKQPFSAAPPKSFDADKLIEALKPVVTGAKCDGNVCPHRHDYLYAPEKPVPSA